MVLKNKYLQSILGGIALAILSVFAKLYFDQLTGFQSGLLAITLFVTISTFRFRRLGGLTALATVFALLIGLHFHDIESLKSLKVEYPLITRFVLTNLLIVLSIDWAQSARMLAEAAKESLAESNSNLKLLIHLAADLQAETDPAQAAQKGFDHLRRLIDVDIFFNYQIDSSGDSGEPLSLKLVAGDGLDSSTMQNFAYIGSQDVPCKRCIINDAPLILTYIQSSKDPLTEPLRKIGVRSYSGFPLKARGKLQGTLCLLSRKRDDFTADEIDIMQTVSLQVAGAQERINREEAIKESDESLRLASMVARLAVLRVDYDRDLVHLDSLATSLYGLGTEAFCISRKSWHDTFHPEDRKVFDQHLQETMAQGTDGWLALEHRVVWPDGSIHWLNIRKQIYFHTTRDGTRRPTHAIIAAHDITEERNAAEELKEAEAKLRMMYETSMMGILQFSPEGKVIDTNDAFLEMVGWNRGQFVTESLSSVDITPPQYRDVTKRAMEEFRATGKIQPFEKQYLKRDGTLVPVLVSGTALDKDWQQGVAFIVDLSHIKAVEQELRHLTENLERRVAERTAEVNERSKQLRGLALDLADTEARERKRLAQILHDHFQQLVSAAKLKVGIVRRKVADATIVDSFRQIESLLDEAITESRSLATELSPPVLHDAGLQAGFEWLARKMKRDHGLDVDMFIEAGSEPDNERVRLVLFDCVREMLFNVVKHAETKRAEIVMRMRFEGLLSIMVRDHGKGFECNRDLTQHSPSGSFGLFSIRERLSMLGGLLDIRAAPGHGTELEITVPVTTRQEEPDGHPDGEYEAIKEPAEAMRTVHVMVADDHKMFREGLISLIRQEPYVNIVAEAGDGAEALELARRTNPDILIVDVSMPKFNGVEVTSILRKERPNIRIIGLSMHERDDMAKAMRDAGAVAYCTKGGPTEVLLNVLKSVASETTQNV